MEQQRYSGWAGPRGRARSLRGGRAGQQSRPGERDTQLSQELNSWHKVGMAGNCMAAVSEAQPRGVEAVASSCPHSSLPFRASSGLSFGGRDFAQEGPPGAAQITHTPLTSAPQPGLSGAGQGAQERQEAQGWARGCWGPQHSYRSCRLRHPAAKG